MRESLLAKYQGIDKSGKEAVLAGNITPYAFPVSLKNRFSVFATLQLNGFLKMFLEKIQLIETRFGLKLILAGRDFQPHITVLEGNLDASKERIDFASLIKKFITGNALGPVEKGMLSGRVLIEQLLLDKGNLLLATAESPFFSIRKKLSSFYQSIGLIPCPLDITHSSISRIAEIPDGFGLDEWKHYHTYVCKLQRFIESDDLVLRISGRYVGEAYEFLTKKAG